MSVTEVFICKLAADVRPIVRRLLAEPLNSAEHLRRGITEHIELLETEQRNNEFLDLEQARNIAQRCLAFLERSESAPSDDHRRLIQIAARYFTIGDDAEDDLSFDGLADDESVVSAVEQLLEPSE